MMSAFTAALARGHNNDGDGKSSDEGSATGALFSLLAIATLARRMIVWTERNKAPIFASIQPWLPVVAWIAAAGFCRRFDCPSW